MRSKRVLLIQGMGGSYIMFPYLVSKLQDAGFEPEFYAPQFLPIKDIRPHARAVALKCRELARESGRPVALIGYSMGGLVAVAAVQIYGAADFVDTIITIGSPFQGTPLAKIAGAVLGKIYISLRQMSPQSSFLDFLKRRVSKKLTIHCIGGAYDTIVWGAENAMHPQADEKIILPATHLMLPFLAVNDIIRILKSKE
ncbi:MAG: alpha/beta fold hydrolase [Patescibacteria group bacterium]